MATLHIQHSISDITTWTAAYARFADMRRQAGVRSESVRQPVGDANWVVIDLEFDTAEQASSFHQFLQTVVWANTDASPALAGAPDVKILEQVELVGASN